MMLIREFDQMRTNQWSGRQIEGQCSKISGYADSERERIAGISGREINDRNLYFQMRADELNSRAIRRSKAGAKRFVTRDKSVDGAKQSRSMKRAGERDGSRYDESRVKRRKLV